MVNLVKFIASSGALSRRQAEEAIRSARVCVDGAVETNPAHRVNPEESVTLDGVCIVPAVKFRYVLLHKPRGYVCSSADEHAEKLAVDLLEGVSERMVSAGRLDKDSEGAIIFSNDGEFINILTHPRYGVLKTYIVHTAAPIGKSDLARMVSGIEDDGQLLKAESVKAIGEKCYEFILNEGKKREIRRLTAACGAPTRRLIRVNIGGVRLDKLPCGSFRELSSEEVEMLKKGEN